jgi:peroxiredoxin Q/BCP
VHADCIGTPLRIRQKKETSAAAESSQQARNHRRAMTTGYCPLQCIQCADVIVHGMILIRSGEALYALSKNLPGSDSFQPEFELNNIVRRNRPMSIQQQPESIDKIRPKRDLNTKLFLGFLLVTSCFYAVILVYHVNRPLETVTDHDSILEQCRQICLQYGLVSTGNIKKDAESYIEAVRIHEAAGQNNPLSTDAAFTPAASQELSLIGQSAPDFELPDDSNVRQRLSVLGKGKPMVVVFYLGYGCSHCVAQLIGLDKDLERFHELGAEVVAISSDTPEHTTERYAEYGRFHFPVLADVDYSVAQAWGVYQPETSDKSEVMDHGTFIVDANGRIIWGQQGKEPFLDNRTLLHLIAVSQGRSPVEPKAETATVAPEVTTR